MRTALGVGRLTLSLLLVLALAGIAGSALAGTVRMADNGFVGGQGNPGVLPPNSTPYGMSYADWGAAWWKWAISIPLALNPLNDQTGANATQGQSGPVWFLAGTFCPDLGSCDLATATRTCVVPAGKALFFPILNGECSTFEGNGTTYPELFDCARGAIDVATGLACEVDGVPIQNLAAYRATSGLFTWGPLPEDNIFGTSPGTTSLAVQDGYYIMLAPLRVGPHTIHFAGAFDGFFALDVTYHLRVSGKQLGLTSRDAPMPAAPPSWGRVKTLYR